LLQQEQLLRLLSSMLMLMFDADHDRRQGLHSKNTATPTRLGGRTLLRSPCNTKLDEDAAPWTAARCGNALPVCAKQGSGAFECQPARKPPAWTCQGPWHANSRGRDTAGSRKAAAAELLVMQPTHAPAPGRPWPAGRRHDPHCPFFVPLSAAPQAAEPGTSNFTPPPAFGTPGRDRSPAGTRGSLKRGPWPRRGACCRACVVFTRRP
jgi:hypothetical protein